MKRGFSRLVLAFAAIGALHLGRGAAAATAYDYRDALDIAVATPDEQTVTQLVDKLTLFAGNDLAYDDNLYRVPSYVSSLTGLPGIQRNPSRADFTDSVAAGLDGEWLVGSRQSFDVDLVVDDNRFIHNTSLNNISTTDHGAWNWGLGGLLTGSVGADYSQVLGGFVNTGVYSRDIVVRSDYFASIRLQAGPRWALFGGIMYQDYKLTAAAATYNNSQTKAVDLGFDYTISTAGTVGFDYRYTDERAPNPIVINFVSFDADYREDRARLLLNYAFTEKTSVEASAGYLQRTYPTTAIGGFSGEIWRVALKWVPTLKTAVVLGTWRQLTADLTAETDYYVDRGFILQPTWNPSDKVNVSFAVSRENQNYIGSNPVGVNPVTDLTAGRRDVVTDENAIVGYTPIRPLTLTLTLGHENRDSNAPQFEYKDFRADINVVYKFFRYGDMP